MIYGALAGATSRTATAPLERLKVLNQVQHLDRVAAARYVGVLPALRKIYAEEGFWAYWKGNGTNVIRIIPSEAARLYTFEIFKKWLVKKGELSPIRNMVAGGLAGMASTLLTFPLDLVRTRLTVQTLPSADSKLLAARYNGMFHCLFKIGKEEGILALYKGMGISLMGIVPYVAINYGSYETIKQLFSDLDPKVFGGLFGGISGAIAVTFTYPTDVLRRRMMMQGLGGDSHRAYNGIWDAIVKVARTEGVPGFFRGLIPCYLKVIPSSAISWATIELCRMLSG